MQLLLLQLLQLKQQQEQQPLLKIYKLVILADSNLASASGDSIVKVWNLNTGELLYTLTGHTARQY